ncbi:MAG: response regulator transcription factor [Gemmatimonadales bacterium]
MAVTLTFLVGRNKLFREGLKSLLSGSQFEVVGEADDVSQARAPLGDQTPSVVLLDFSAELEHAVDDVTHLRGILPEVKIVILVEALSSQSLAACLGAGAHGYLIKDISVDALLQSLRLVMLGEKVFPTHLAALLVNGMADTAPARKATSHGLSEREGQVLQCLVQGDSNKIIANRLNITEATIKVHMKSLLRKINATNRTQAAIWALKNGLGPNVAPTEAAE